MIKKEDLKKANESLKTIPVKGNDYVQVADRVNAFREICVNGCIATEIISLENGVVTMKSTITDDEGKILATGYAQEKESASYINKTSFIENCETSAVGRALGFLGIGLNAGISSAEELANAITNQKDEFTDIANLPIDAIKVKVLKDKIKKDSIDEAKLLDVYGLKKLEDMKEKQFSNCTNHWESVIEKCKKA